MEVASQNNGHVRDPRMRFAAAFFLITSLTIFWTRFSGGLALVWLGTAVLSALLIHLPRAKWKSAMLAFVALSTLATSLFGFGPEIALPLALINVFEGWLVASALLLIRPQRDFLHSLPGLASLACVGGLLAPLAAGVPGGMLASTVSPGLWYQHAGNWIAGHGLGTMLAFPIMYMAATGELGTILSRWTRRASLEMAGLMLLVTAVAAVSFFQAIVPLQFLPIIPLLLLSFRRGRLGATLGTAAIAATGGLALHLDAGYLEGLALSTAHKVLYLQFYLAVILLLGLPAAVALKAHQLLMGQLEQKKALRSLVDDHSDDALLNLDPDGIIRFASLASERLSGETELTGRHVGLFFDPLDDLLVRGILAQAAAAPGETRVLERAVVRGDDQLWLEAKVRAVGLEDGSPGITGYAVTIRDVSERKHSELLARQDAETDPLTGLPNRRALLKRLEPILAGSGHRPFALAIVDLDHFKAVNDSHGHNTGDAVLRDVARVMRRMATGNRFFARLGGEEFALVAQHGDFEESVAFCEALRGAIGSLSHATPHGRRIAVTASIGLARIAGVKTAADALQAADALLYKAKDAGRNRTEASPATPVERANRKAA